MSKNHEEDRVRALRNGGKEDMMVERNVPALADQRAAYRLSDTINIRPADFADQGRRVNFDWTY